MPAAQLHGQDDCIRCPASRAGVRACSSSPVGGAQVDCAERAAVLALVWNLYLLASTTVSGVLPLWGLPSPARAQACAPPLPCCA